MSIEKYYVQILEFDCLLCHQPVVLTEARPQRLECGCTSISVEGEAYYWDLEEIKDYSKKTRAKEHTWAEMALEVNQKEVKVPDLVGPNSVSWEEWKKFFEPYQKAHSEWLQAHPIEVCDCCWLEEQDRAPLSRENPLPPTSEPCKTSRKTRTKTTQLSLFESQREAER